MFIYITRRILWTIPVLLAATLLTFGLIKALPYEAFTNNVRIAPSVRDNLLKLYGLDKSWYEQYWVFVTDLVQGDLGLSTRPGAPSVESILSSTLPVSMQLGLYAFIFALVLGTFVGVISALRANGIVDYSLTVISTLFFAVPSFVIARYWVDLFPGYYGWDTWWERVGPVTVLGLAIMPYFVRLVRASMLETLQADFIITARAKGLPWRRTVVRHVLRNSLIPMVTNAGPLFGFVLTGSFVIEQIMNIPGVAFEFIQAFRTPLDTRLALVTTVLFSVIIILMNLVVDVIVAWLDPRITHD